MTRDEENPRVARAREITQKLMEENKMAIAPWTIQKVLVSDMVIDEL